MSLFKSKESNPNQFPSPRDAAVLSQDSTALASCFSPGSQARDCPQPVWRRCWESNPALLTCKGGALVRPCGWDTLIGTGRCLHSPVNQPPKTDRALALRKRRSKVLNRGVFRRYVGSKALRRPDSALGFSCSDCRRQCSTKERAGTHHTTGVLGATYSFLLGFVHNSLKVLPRLREPPLPQQGRVHNFMRQVVPVADIVRKCGDQTIASWTTALGSNASQ